MLDHSFFYLIAAALCAGLISFTTTPLARVFAFKVGAVDVPKDERRMHNKPIPRLGGLAIFLGFSVAALAFCDFTPTLLSIYFGGLVIVVVGVLDDIFRLNAWVKFIVEIAVAFIPISQGLSIEFINLFGEYVVFGVFEIPITILWIVGLTNAINLIDGLDGLSCGISVICSLSLLLCSILVLDNFALTMLTAILAASCLGFLPFNSNPAKIFMGDTGALFLGYTLSVISISGLFKMHAVLSFMIPVSIFALPLFDTIFAFVRRIASGHSPFRPDRGHIHHRLIDIGFNQKQTVYILYSVCGILGISAVMFSISGRWMSGMILVVAFLIFAFNYAVLKHPETRKL
ncbi:MAG: undecaprenyl/decaprenyl-phosphate alpha-N-acetylglucosaminyl 1-phosphate transferase, partial [Clostridia bacterium]|nr:undecaprenyl/decaprenyl-phosphate alpha-N-acetylglucosaminyl 1-phosphate transferase [Clostridia bacterium]